MPNSGTTSPSRQRLRTSLGSALIEYQCLSDRHSSQRPQRTIATEQHQFVPESARQQAA
jgi:hypothetical protein